jgi:hypothetical protein
MGEVLKGMREMYAAEQAAISDEYNRIAKKKGVQS